MRDPRELQDMVNATIERQHAMQLVPPELLEPDRLQPRDVVAAAEAERWRQREREHWRLHYTAPAPPPAELGFDLAKWRNMSRAERRAVLRYAKKRGK